MSHVSAKKAARLPGYAAVYLETGRGQNATQIFDRSAEVLECHCGVCVLTNHAGWRSAL